MSTDNDHICLVGKTDAPRVEILINQRNLIVVDVIDSVFHKYITFGFGVNEILIRPLYDDTIGADQPGVRLEILSSPHSTGRLGKLYPSFQFHSTDQESGCRDCHRSLSDLSPAVSGASPCTECHREFADREVLHAGLTRKDCGICHNQQTNQASNSDGGLSGNPCYGCHPDKIEKFDQEYIHGPVAGGSCSVCHDPHGSKFKHSLINEEEVLCFSCHEFEREFKDMPFQHEPFLGGHCGDCHDPHATDNRWVLSRSSEDLCFKCHTPDEGVFKNHVHPYNVKPKSRYSSSVRLSESGTLECISCHNPHAGRKEHLLRSNQKNTCLGCHKEKS
jgi:predicted CXXCH cytochrome family protein